MIDTLDPIAKFDGKEIKEAFAAGADVSMIGHFNVGFYFAYLIDEQVIVTRKHSDVEQRFYNSHASCSITVTRDTIGQDMGRVMKITIYLQKDQLEYLHRLNNLVNKHSEFINYYHPPLY